MPILDQDTGQFLEHRHLRHHPKQKAMCYMSYANELGRLCQGIGKHATHPHKKHIEASQTSANKISPTPAWSDQPLPHTNHPWWRPHPLPWGLWHQNQLLRNRKTFLNNFLSIHTACTPLDRPKYACIKLTNIPKELIWDYGLHDFAHNGYIYFKVSMASKRLANWPMTCSPNAWNCTDTTNEPQHQAFGATSSMTSASNTLNVDMPNTSCMPSQSITWSPLTGLVLKSWAYISSGTTPSKPATLPWTPT
eukprot:CCRYP_000989-RA/>CCRYP_000989-RA protein AED:0.36 eAED:0.38 QI:0/0/0/1/0/0/3/0/249